MTCTFFGHRNAPKEIEPTLRSTLIDLIENHYVNLFYVGNHGNFDGMVRRVLKDLAEKYDITYYVVLAYMPGRLARVEPVTVPLAIFSRLHCGNFRQATACLQIPASHTKKSYGRNCEAPYK